MEPTMPAARPQGARDGQPANAHEIILVDDHVLFRDALRTLLETRGHSVVGEADGARAGVDLAREHPDAIVLLDIALGDDQDGLWVARSILEKSPSAKIIFVTASDSDDSLMTAVSIGAAGFVPKTTDPEQLFAAIEVVAAGGAVLAGGMMSRLGAGINHLDYRPGELERRQFDLSDREFEVLRLLATSRTYAQIAAEMYLSPKTVEHYATSLYRKLDVKSRQQAVMVASERGLLRH
jgi:DNA-binding NarL/FixJ family response regulator